MRKRSNPSVLKFLHQKWLKASSGGQGRSSDKLILLHTSPVPQILLNSLLLPEIIISCFISLERRQSLQEKKFITSLPERNKS